MPDYDDPLEAARRNSVPTRIGRSNFPAVDQMIRGGALSQGFSNRELLSDPRTRYQGETHLMQGTTYDPSHFFNLDSRPEISPRLGTGLLVPGYSGPRRNSFFPGLNLTRGLNLPPLAGNDRDDLMRDIEGTFYGGGHANPTPTPTPVPGGRSYFANNPWDDWHRQYGFNV